MELLRLVYQTLGILGDHKLLVGRNNQNANTCPVDGDIHLLAAVLVLLRIDLDAEVLEMLADIPANRTVVLAYACGEDDRVYADMRSSTS